MPNGVVKTVSAIESLKEELPTCRPVAKRISQDLTIYYQEKSNSFILIIWHVLGAQFMFGQVLCIEVHWYL